ncbi:hypothetical protein B4U80_04592 [Leptotrombidium deliense]|uniref:XK-related protein n=1 Tax=Leptotrombidium deliense TaxID=299467 RepID=A0A443SI98_9ACAR|nr:hypothetical protein B4U80_04592 [Leptotrombidium deliense]
MVSFQTRKTKEWKENHDSSEYIDYKLLSVHEDRDTALLSLLKSFMESAPMAVLQLQRRLNMCKH